MTPSSYKSGCAGGGIVAQHEFYQGGVVGVPLAAAEKISASSVARSLRLTFLAPEVVWRRGVSCREIIGQDTDAAWKDAFNERRFAGVLG